MDTGFSIKFLELLIYQSKDWQNSILCVLIFNPQTFQVLVYSGSEHSPLYFEILKKKERVTSAKLQLWFLHTARKIIYESLKSNSTLEIKTELPTLLARKHSIEKIFLFRAVGTVLELNKVEIMVVQVLTVNKQMEVRQCFLFFLIHFKLNFLINNSSLAPESLN